MIESIARNWNVLLAFFLSAGFAWYFGAHRRNVEFAAIFVLIMFIALFMLKR